MSVGAMLALEIAAKYANILASDNPPSTSLFFGGVNMRTLVECTDLPHQCPLGVGRKLPQPLYC